MARIVLPGCIFGDLYRAPDGFYFGSDGRITFCALIDEDNKSPSQELIDDVKRDIGSETLDWYSFAGYFGVKIDAKEKDLIPIAIQRFLNRGHKVMMVQKWFFNLDLNILD